jgi:autotransporter-associated beta strand protein
VTYGGLAGGGYINNASSAADKNNRVIEIGAGGAFSNPVSVAMIRTEGTVTSLHSVKIVKTGPGSQTFSGGNSSYHSDTVVRSGELITTVDSWAYGISAAPTVMNTTTETVTLNGHGLTNGTRIVLGGTTPGGTDSWTVYYVRDADANTFRLSTAPDLSNLVNLSGTNLAWWVTRPGAFGSATTAIALGDAGTAAGDNIRLSTGAAATIARAVNVNNYGTGTTIGGNADVTSTFSGLITLNKSLTIAQVATTGSNALNITGGITSGAAGTQTVTFAGPGNVNVHTGAIGGGTDTIAVKVVGGTVTVTGVNTYAGGTAVNAGTLLVDLSINNAGVLASTGALTLGGGTFKLKGKTGAGNTSSQVQTSGDVSLTAGTNSRIVIDPNGGDGTNLTLGSTWNRGAGATLSIDLSAAGTSTLTSSPLLIGSILPYATVKEATGTGFATVSGSGTVVRYTTVNELQSNSDASTTDFTTKYNDTDYVGGTLFMTNASRAINSLSIDASADTGVIDLSGTANVLTLTSGGILMTGNNNYTIQNGQATTNNADLIVHQLGAGVLTLNLPFNAGAGGLAKTGPGTLVLGGANTYAGATDVFGGTLRLDNADAALSSTVNLSAGTILTFGTGATTYNVGGLSGSGNVDTTSNPITLNVGGNGASTSHSGVISGAGALSKTGAGTWTISGANTFTGQLSVKAGTLAIGSINNASADGVLGNSANAVSLGDTGGVTGTLQYTGATASSTKKFTLATDGTGAFQVDVAATNLTLSGVIDGSGNMNKSGAGTLTLAGANTFGGQLSVKAGTLAIGSINNAFADGVLGNSDNLVSLGNTGATGTLQYTGTNAASNKRFTMATGGTGAFQVDNAGTVLTLSSAIDGGGSLSKTGAGTLLLTGGGSYGGSTSIKPARSRRVWTTPCPATRPSASAAARRPRPWISTRSTRPLPSPA